MKPLSREPQDGEVTGFTHGGEGVVRVEGKAVFVPGTIPGERVRLQVVDDRRSWARARLVAVLEPSPDRVAPACPYVPDCGGCDLQHVDAAAQRALKTRVVREQLQRLGGVADPPVAACRPVGGDLGYRTNARMQADHAGRLGFHRSGSDEVVPIDRCVVLEPGVQRLRDAVGDTTGAQRAVLRSHASTSTEAVVLTPGPGPLELPEGGFDLLLEQPDGRTLAVRGDGELVEHVDGFTFRFPAPAFFQVSPNGASALVGGVLEAAGDVAGALVWDLYAGVGLLSLPLAAAGADVTAVEGLESAAAAARDNAAENGVDIEVIHAPVDAFTARAAAGDGPDPPDVVVLDPPRSGAGAAVLDRVAALAPGAIVYVACDVAALARDTRVLGDAGYRLRSVVPLDLFPMTHHVEVVAAFAP